MEKPIHFFATEVDSGKDTSRLTVDRLKFPIADLAAEELRERSRLVTSDQPARREAEVYADEKTPVRRRHMTDGGRIAVKAKGRVLFVDPLEVFVAKAQGNYVALIHKSGSYFVRETMATAEQKLTPLGFVRIHRCTLVNATLVKDLRRDNTGTYVLRTTDGCEHPVGRAYKSNLKAIARSWMGVELV
jgi:DNA-binding LytR/AlgR family response regulator